MKIKLQFLLGSLLLFASTSVFAGLDGKVLYQEISSEITQYEAENRISDLMSRIRKTVESAQMRSFPPSPTPDRGGSTRLPDTLPRS